MFIVSKYFFTESIILPGRLGDFFGKVLNYNSLLSGRKLKLSPGKIISGIDEILCKTN